MYTISKDFHFSYSHQLGGLAADHPCARLHGHNAVIRVELGSDTLDDTGFVIDYGDLKPFGDWIMGRFDHQHLNYQVTFNPTSEHLARHVYTKAVALGYPVTGVGWSETPKTWAWWRP